MRRVEVAVFAETFDQAIWGLAGDECLEHRGRVNDKHRSGSITPCPHGGNDRRGAGTTRTPSRSCQQVGHRRVLGNALKLTQHVVR